MRTVYKVVERSRTGYTSIMAGGKWRKTYKLGEKTTNDTPLFCFDTLVHASAFAEAFADPNLIVLECTAEMEYKGHVPNVVPYTGVLQGTWDDFWNDPVDWLKHTTYMNTRLPVGTLFYYDVTPRYEVAYWDSYYEVYRKDV